MSFRDRSVLRRSIQSVCCFFLIFKFSSHDTRYTPLQLPRYVYSIKKRMTQFYAIPMDLKISPTLLITEVL